MIYDSIFYTIPKAVYEPLGVVVLLWGIVSLIFFRKRNTFHFMIFTLAVFLMLAWRIIGHTIMYSSRYSVILIYPTIIFCACFCCKLPQIFRWSIGKIHWDFSLKREVGLFLAVTVVVGLCIAALVKDVRFNRYGDYAKKISLAYIQKKKPAGILHVHREYRRVLWYTKCKKAEITEYGWQIRRLDLPLIREWVLKYKNAMGDHYFIFLHDKKQPEPDQKNLLLTPEDGSWKIIARYYTSKRKKTEILLVHYIPNCPNVKEWQGKVPALPRKNLCRYGGFENPLAGKIRNARQAHYRKLEIKGYTDLTRRKLPHGWSPGVGKWNKKNPPDTRLVEKDPIAGKYSLLLNSQKPVGSAWLGSWSYFNCKRARYSMFVRTGGNVDTQFIVSLTRRIYNPGQKKYTVKRYYQQHFRLKPGRLYRLYDNIPEDNSASGKLSLNLQITCRGIAVVDQISVEEY